MDLIGTAKTIQIFGRTGTGKSNRARCLSANYDRIIIVDRSGEDYTNGIIFDNLAELKAFWNATCKGRFRLIYRQRTFDDDTLRDELETLADWCLKCKNTAFLIEELNVVFNGFRLPPRLRECIFLGRKRGVELITVSQRPRGYGQEFASQAKEFYIFQTHNTDDLKYFRDLMDDAALEAIENLQPYHYLRWSMDEPPGERMEILKDEFIPPNLG